MNQFIGKFELDEIVESITLDQMIQQSKKNLYFNEQNAKTFRSRSFSKKLNCNSRIKKIMDLNELKEKRPLTYEMKKIRTHSDKNTYLFEIYENLDL